MRAFIVAFTAGVITFFIYYHLFYVDQEIVTVANGKNGNSEGLTTKTTMSHVPVDTDTVQSTVAQTPAETTTVQTTTVQTTTVPTTISKEDELMEKIRKKLQPHALNQTNGALVQHQFLHLHHMKTGGTSMDGLINCAMQRLKRDLGYSINYANIHECSQSSYRRCISGADMGCRQRIKDASMMSYCAPLKDLGIFSWETTQEHPIRALTVLRHPVARAWSMFRFQTKRCYQCKPLKEVYAEYDKRSKEELENDMCAAQLMNHQTRNLLTKVEGTDEEKVEQAIEDMHTFFTMIGLTEDMGTTAAMVGKVFPWLAETMNGTSLTCPFPHANSSPRNNRCGPGGKHWDLPDEPDEETAELIRQHNQLDLQVYEAAVKIFEMQRKALDL